MRRILFALFACVLLAVSPAAAHTDLVSSEPSDGQTLRKPPRTISLTFGENLLSAGSRLVAQDADGAAVTIGSPQVDGAVLSAAWPSSAAQGAFTVSYRTVAADGHPLEGKVRFTIAAPAPASATPATQVSPAAGTVPDQTSQTVNPALIWGPLLLVVLLAGAGVFVWRSRE